MRVIAMIDKIKNSIIRLNVIDNKQKDFWKSVIAIISFMIFIVAVISILFVYLGVLPDAANETLCRWYTPVTRGQLGDACN